MCVCVNNDCHQAALLLLTLQMSDMTPPPQMQPQAVESPTSLFKCKTLRLLPLTAAAAETAEMLKR